MPNLEWIYRGALNDASHILYGANRQFTLQDCPTRRQQRGASGQQRSPISPTSSKADRKPTILGRYAFLDAARARGWKSGRSLFDIVFGFILRCSWEEARESYERRSACVSMALPLDFPHAASHSLAIFVLFNLSSFCSDILILSSVLRFDSGHHLTGAALQTTIPAYRRRRRRRRRWPFTL